MDYLLTLLPESMKKLPSHMDFDGQKRAERTFQITIFLFSVVGFVWGYMCQQFSQTVYILGAGFVLSALLTLPPWPMYRVKPLNWQKSRQQDSPQDGTTQAPVSSGDNKYRKKK